METITSKNMLKSVIRGLPTISTAGVGQKLMVYDSNGNPVGKIQAPTEEQKTPLKPAATKPTASAETMGYLWLIGPDQSGYYMQSVTVEDDSTTPSTYSWYDLGTTQIDLTAYEASEQDVRNIVTNYTPD